MKRHVANEWQAEGYRALPCSEDIDVRVTDRQPLRATECGGGGTLLSFPLVGVLVLPKLFADEALYQVSDFLSHGKHTC